MNLLYSFMDMFSGSVVVLATRTLCHINESAYNTFCSTFLLLVKIDRYIHRFYLMCVMLLAIVGDLYVF